jgi:hypothetical protein
MVSMMKAKLGGEIEKNNCFSKNIVLPISVGEAYHEGEKLQASLRMIENRFPKVDILLGDTSQRHNISTNVKAHQITKVQGDDWLKRNNNIFKKLKIPFSIIRWDDCLQWPTYQRWFEIVNKRLETDSIYYSAFQQDIDKFQKRNIKQLQNLVDFNSNNLSYLIEENAAILSLFIDKKYDYILYPSRMPKSVYMSLEIFCKTQSLRHLKIYFKKKKNMLNQDSVVA